MEARDHLLGVRGERDLHEGLERQADFRRLHARRVAADHARILEALHAALARRGREADALRERHEGQPALALEGAEDAAVGGIEGDGGFGHDGVES